MVKLLGRSSSWGPEVTPPLGTSSTGPGEVSTGVPAQSQVTLYPKAIYKPFILRECEIRRLQRRCYSNISLTGNWPETYHLGGEGTG